MLQPSTKRGRVTKFEDLSIGEKLNEIMRVLNENTKTLEDHNKILYDHDDDLYDQRSYLQSMMRAIRWQTRQLSGYTCNEETNLNLKDFLQTEFRNLEGDLVNIHEEDGQGLAEIQKHIDDTLEPAIEGKATDITKFKERKARGDLKKAADEIYGKDWNSATRHKRGQRKRKQAS